MTHNPPTGEELINAVVLEQEHPGLVASIFPEYITDTPHILQMERPYFANPEWKILLLPSTIEYLNLERMLRAPHWKGSPEVGIIEPLNYLALIVSAIWNARPTCFYASQPEYFARSGRHVPKDRPVVKMWPSASSVEEVVNSRIFKAGQFSSMLFDDTGRWGMYDFGDSDSTVLGAEDELYAQIVAVLGGVERIQERFKVWLHFEALDALQHVEEGSERYQRWYRYLVAQYRPIYDHIGWPWPFAAEITPENYPTPP